VNPDKTICVDFDGVIHKYSIRWKDPTIYDLPNEGAKEEMERLVRKGYHIVILTARINEDFHKGKGKEHKKEIEEWLANFGFEIGKHYHLITDKKVPAFAYIDDRAIRFTNWRDVGTYF
jgi:hypothetical protein